MQADYEGNQKFMELIDPSYKREPFSEEAAVYLFEKRIKKIVSDYDDKGG